MKEIQDSIFFVYFIFLKRGPTNSLEMLQNGQYSDEVLQKHSLPGVQGFLTTNIPIINIYIYIYIYIYMCVCVCVFVCLFL